MIAEPTHRAHYGSDVDARPERLRLCIGLATCPPRDNWRIGGVPMISHDVAFYVMREWRETYEVCKPIWFEGTSEEQFVYFAIARDGALKLGWSRDPMRRAQSLGGHELLVVVANSSFKDEQWMHKRFAPFRLRGEWYQPHSPITNLAYWLRKSAR